MPTAFFVPRDVDDQRTLEVTSIHQQPSAKEVENSGNQFVRFLWLKRSGNYREGANTFHDSPSEEQERHYSDPLNHGKSYLFLHQLACLGSLGPLNIASHGAPTSTLTMAPAGRLGVADEHLRGT